MTAAHAGSGHRLTHRQILLLSVLLAALGVTQARAQYAVPPPGPAPLPAQYKQLAVAALADQLRDKLIAGFAEVSAPRASAAPQPGEWMVCLRSSMSGVPAYFALFYADGKVELLRRAVAIDRCGTAEYAPLPPPAKLRAATTHRRATVTPAR